MQRVGNTWVMSESSRDYVNIPDIQLVSLVMYVERGVSPGDFLTGVLEDSVRRAFAHADLQSIGSLWAIATWLFNRAPQACWGSRVIVGDWRNRGGLHGVTRGDVDDVREWRRSALLGTVLQDRSF